MVSQFLPRDATMTSTWSFSDILWGVQIPWAESTSSSMQTEPLHFWKWLFQTSEATPVMILDFTTGEYCNLTQQPQKLFSKQCFISGFTQQQKLRSQFFNVSLFFFFNSNSKNRLLHLEGMNNWRNCTTPPPPSSHYSIAFLHPHLILWGENNSLVLMHLVRNQQGKHRFSHWSATSMCPLQLRSIKDTLNTWTRVNVA